MNSFTHPVATRSPRMRRRWRAVGIASITMAVTLVGISVSPLVGRSSHAGAASNPLGAVTLSVSSGNQDTVFSMIPPVGAACTGAGTIGYRFHAYIVDAANDPATLSYTTSGPSGGTGLQAFLVSGLGGSAWSNKNPAASPLGGLTDLVDLKMASLKIGTDIANGSYKIGYICTQNSTIDTGKYWEARITVTNVAKNSVTPASSTFSWTVAATPPTSSSSRSTSSSSSSTSSTSSSSSTTSSTTTTVRPTTTVAGSSTTASTTTVAQAGGPTTTSPTAVTLPARIPQTGSSTTPLLLLAIVLLVFGRMALLLGRPLRVAPASTDESSINVRTILKKGTR